MIDLPAYDAAPACIDWQRTRCFWLCPPLASSSDADNPVQVRSEVESSILAAFGWLAEQIRGMGASRVWLGDPARDGVDWLDARTWYAVLGEFEHPPEQEARPYRLSPLVGDDGCMDDAFTQFDRGCKLLKSGKIKEGLPLYEYRWNTQQGFRQRPTLEMPHWDGRAPGKVLIHAEQGAGDIIHYARYLRHVDFDAELLTTQDTLRLLRGIWPGRVMVQIDPAVEYDWHLPLCSLPLARGIDLFEPCEPYIHAEPVELVGHPSVGIAWSGSVYHMLNALRCRRLEEVLEYCPKGAAVVSLQMGEPCEQLRFTPQVVDASPLLLDWQDTAQIVAGLDEVVCIDTGLSHLAGAMGKPTTLLLKGSIDWRWLNEGSTTALYPTMRLIR